MSSTERVPNWIFRFLPVLSLLFLLFPTVSVQGQQVTQVVQKDSARMELLYVSDKLADHPARDYQRDIDGKAVTDSIYAAVTEGVVDYQKISYRSSIDGMEIPAYVYQPLEKRGPGGHPAMVWVHGGVHGNWGASMWPFVREAVERGYVVIAPEYRGSTGYGAEHHRAIDYGAYEVDDCMDAYGWMVENLPHVDPARVGMMGWSHGGFITIHSITRENHPFQAGAAIVPVTNLIFRLSYKGPRYQRSFSTQERIEGLPFEQREKYLERSPYYQVDDLKTPLLVHVATNDQDVDFVEGSPPHLQASGHAPPPHRDPDLYRSGAMGILRWARIQSPGRPGNAGEGGLSLPDRLLEQDLDLLRLESPALPDRAHGQEARGPVDCLG